MLTKDRIAEIYKIVQYRLINRGLEETTENRLAMLQSIRDEWLEEVLVPEDMDRYLVAIEIMISKDTYKIMFPNN